MKDLVLMEMGKTAQATARRLRQVSVKEKNEALEKMAQALEEHQEAILQANQEDCRLAQNNGLSSAMIERLSLNPERVVAMAQGLRFIATLADPTQMSDRQWVNEDGLLISRRRVPIGVIGIIYESRPNVTVDATGLCLKAGNAVILRGGKEALNSNRAIVQAMQTGLKQTVVPASAVQLIEDPSRELATALMQFNECIDCLIPRGGAGLISSVVKNATVPVIETGTGNCHLYCHEAADLAMARDILLNGKVQRPSVCNALETVLVDRSIAAHAVPYLAQALLDQGVEIRGDEATCHLVPQAVSAKKIDYQMEFLDYVIAFKVVDNYQEAIDHIEQYSTGHSEVIITQNYQVAQDFVNDIDSAAVYVNASTRFTDGAMFGFGGEIGISTQKLHARGPMGLEALTSYKYIVLGSGQVRA
ncbi:glutamate-5-semialdehyde dehydrogenase [Vaginisenegalia massiliensis]|uniref:glutamate-5-semialdehyde dehydrogenase n=1 Tax=Vaginisenegalia massiliensis TaxID=2058294 RepID=UPI000F5221FF|nr:glutamate-5-semialdehyde dehydrogenase [Vaginisenegalia massiliensis]